MFSCQVLVTVETTKNLQVSGNFFMLCNNTQLHSHWTVYILFLKRWKDIGYYRQPITLTIRLQTPTFYIKNYLVAQFGSNALLVSNLTLLVKMV